MRDQYAGDVSDVLKFALLRALVRQDRTLGVAWYYAPGDDGRPDGRHLEWRDEAAWRLLDAELHTGLATLPERSIAALERAAIWPNGSRLVRRARSRCAAECMRRVRMDACLQPRWLRRRPNIWSASRAVDWRETDRARSASHAVQRPAMGEGLSAELRMAPRELSACNISDLVGCGSMGAKALE